MLQDKNAELFLINPKWHSVHGLPFLKVTLKCDIMSMFMFKFYGVFFILCGESFIGLFFINDLGNFQNPVADNPVG